MSEDLVAVMPYGPEGASSRVRVLDWIEWLKIDAKILDYGGLSSNRPDVLMRHPLVAARGEHRLRFGSGTTSRLILSREASPFSVGRIEGRLLRNAAVGIYDFDDALFNDTGQGVRRIFSKAKKCAAAVAAADRVIVGNDYLAEWASERNANVTVIPSCVDPGSYVHKSTWTMGEVPRLIWMGSTSTEVFLRTIAPALMHLNRHRGARLTVVSGTHWQTLGDLDSMIDRIPWSRASFAALLAGGDVGISPIDDTPYARGKCAYKLLQYAASGLPVAGSPVGANALALERFDGLAPRTTAEWTDALIELVDEAPSRRERRGRTALSAVSLHYSFEAWASVWKSTVML